MVMRNVLLATEAGLGNGETPIFPHPDFSASRRASASTPAIPTTTCIVWPSVPAPSASSPISASWTRPSTSSIIRRATPETEIAYMGCRTRVIGNVYDPHPGRSAPAAATSPSPPSTFPASPSRQRATVQWFFEELERMLGPGGMSSFWSALKSSPTKRSTTSPSSWARACGWIPKS